MASAQVLGGSEAVTLDDAVFGAPFNGPLVHECVVAEMAARRRGTHATLTRGMVSGGTSKPWRQKGTGRARAGSSRSPLWTGGGTVFGPSPRHYTVKVNRKARRAALRSALSVHAARGSIFVVDAGAFAAPSTKQAHALVAERRAGSLLVVLAGEAEAAAAKSFRNLAGVSVLPADGTGVADIVGAATLVVSRDALDALTDLAARAVARGGGDARTAAAAPAGSGTAGAPAGDGSAAERTGAASSSASSPAASEGPAAAASAGDPAPPHGEPSTAPADAADDAEEPA